MANDSKYGRLYPERAVKRLREMAESLSVDGRLATPTHEQLRRALADLDELGFPPDEPLFLLRGQDTLAPAIVREYALYVQDADLPGRQHIEEHADRMEAWQPRKLPD